MVKKKGKIKCCGGNFPTFAVILLVIGVLWLLSDLGVITVDVPWVPVVLIIIALGAMCHKHKGMKK